MKNLLDDFPQLFVICTGKDMVPLVRNKVPQKFINELNEVTQSLEAAYGVSNLHHIEQSFKDVDLRRFGYDTLNHLLLDEKEHFTLYFYSRPRPLCHAYSPPGLFPSTFYRSSSYLTDWTSTFGGGPLVVLGAYQPLVHDIQQAYAISTTSSGSVGYSGLYPAVSNILGFGCLRGDQMSLTRGADPFLAFLSRTDTGNQMNG